jgi:predicted ATPase
MASPSLRPQAAHATRPQMPWCAGVRGGRSMVTRLPRPLGGLQDAGEAGQIAEGLRLLGEALAVMANNGLGDLLAEAHRLQGELLLRQDPPEAAQAEACFQQALAIARRQQAKSRELRAATSLSLLWQHQGKADEARQLLGETHGWFAEGFDTAGLQDAKALLEDLS